MSARIVIADSPAAIQAFRDVLTTSLPITGAETLEQARAALDPAPSLVVCGCHFDEGRMYDLLRHMKATPALQNVPFMAIRILEGELDDALYESVKIAVRALGGNAFVDLLRWRRRWGDAEASHRLTHLVQTLAASLAADSG